MCHNLIAGKTPQKVHFLFLLKVKFWRVVRTFLTSSRQLLDQFGWNLARLLPDSFSTKPCLQISIPLFVLKLDLVSAQSASSFVFSDFICYSKKDKHTCQKSETRFFSHRCQEENAVLIVLFSLFLEGVEPNLWRRMCEKIYPFSEHVKLLPLFEYKVIFWNY